MPPPIGRTGLASGRSPTGLRAESDRHAVSNFVCSCGAIGHFDWIRERGVTVAIKLEMGWRVVAAAGFLLILAIAIGGMFAASPATWWAYLVLGIFAAFAAWAFVRIWNVRVSYDANQLTVVGVLRSRQIPRRSITAVDREPANAWVTWRSPTGRRRMTPLMAVWGNHWGGLPEGGLKRRREFLKRVARWARS